MTTIKSPLVYIVIINWNGYKDTRRCLDSIKNIKYQNYKIVVIDNGSKNNEAIKLKNTFNEIILLQNKKNLGFAKATNQGIRRALLNEKTKYVLILNNDTIVKDDFLNILINQCVNQKKIICAPKTLNYKTNIVQTMGCRVLPLLGTIQHINKNKKSSDCNNVIEPDSLNGCCILISKSALLDIGLFDEEYFAYYEDIDWNIRAKFKKYNLKVFPDSIIWHKKSESTRGSYFKIYLLAKNIIYFSNKNFNGIKKYIFILNGLAIHLIIGIIRYKTIFFLRKYFKGIKDGIKLSKKL
jgi:GT2 family glycosyltransferase